MVIHIRYVYQMRTDMSQHNMSLRDAEGNAYIGMST